MLAVLKTFALFYILQSFCVATLCGLWPFVERRIPKISQGKWLVFSLAFAVGAAFAASLGVSIATALGYLRMVTNGFTFLMEGPFELTIILIGIFGLFLSVLASAFLLGERKISELPEDAEVYRINDVLIKVSDFVPTAGLIGVKKPVIVLSKRIWQDKDSLKLVLLHELLHLRLKHNLLKFVARTILRVNFIFPWVHWLVNRLELLCELDCDHRMVELVGVKKYGEFLLRLPMESYAMTSGLTTALTQRIHELGRPCRGSVFFGFIPLACVSLVLLLPFLPTETRCFLACFLGY